MTAAEAPTALRAELPRKAVHVAMGGFALALRWLTPGAAIACAAGALLFNYFLLHKLTRRALLRPHEKARGSSLGILLYPAAVLVLLVVFRNRLELAAAAWGLIAFGDGMASVAGLSVGGPRLPWNRDKTWSGLLAFIFWGTAASAFLLRWVQLGALDGPKDWIGASLFDRTALIGACATASLLAGLVESLDTGIDDNITVPATGAATLYAATLVDPSLIVQAGPTLVLNLIVGAAVNAGFAIAALAARGVTPSGAITGTFLGMGLYAFSGWRGFAMLLLFFFLGTAATKLGYAKKLALGIAQEKGGRRGPRNAIANVAAGVAFAFLMVATPHHTAFALALVAAFATAAADTVSSEIGQAYGRTTYLITSFRRVSPGTEGAVSLEGTLAGIAASAVLAATAAATGLIPASGIGIVVAAAFLGTTLESYLGATLATARAMDNEVMNFLNTAAGGLAAIGISVVL
jgi:uncharacterized protein (TIGR00297 family)